MPTPRPSLTLTDAAGLIAEAGFGGRPSRVGLELEWFVTRDGRRTDSTVVVDRSIRKPGPLPCESGITFEPGGQLEISTRPARDGASAVQDAAHDAAAAATRVAADGFDLTAIGLDATGPAPRILDAPRYAAMEQYFADRGHRGTTMMCGTASMQVNVGWADDRDEQWRAAHDLAPVLGAMFAHSPLYDRRPSGWQSSRLAVWGALDPPRTAAVAATPSPCEAWVRYAMEAPVMAVPAESVWHVPTPTTTLRDWITDGHRHGYPTPDDVQVHLTTLFPPIRPRGWLELRILDALPEPWWRVAAAISVVALTDDNLRRRLADVVRPVRGRWLDAAWHGVHDPGIGQAAATLIDLALPVVADSGYDADTVLAAHEFADRYTSRGRSPADDRLDDWARSGSLHPMPEPVPVAG